MEMEMECPADFKCPISMELMTDPVTICTGVTYERKNIEKWFFIYKKNTCPATMQSLHSFHVTPNHTLNRLIQAWAHHPTPTPSINHDDILSLLTTIQSSPFKLTSLKKLRSILQMGHHTRANFIRAGGVQVVVQIVVQNINILSESSSDFLTFRACEEALGVLHQLPLSEQDQTFDILSKLEFMRSMAVVLQRGSAEARVYVITIFRNMAKADYKYWNLVIQDQGIDFFKSLLELVSDEICTKASTCALEVLIEILSASKNSRLRAIEAGAVCVLIELLPDSSSRSKCEKILILIKILSECAEGRLALVEHKMGIAAVSKKLLNVSNAATKIGVKIMWLICSSHPTENVMEEMLMYGTVKKLLTLLHLHVEGRSRSSTKDKVAKMLKMHGNSWMRYPCFPSELKEYLGFLL